MAHLEPLETASGTQEAADESVTPRPHRASHATAPTSLMRAATPHLDELANRQGIGRIQTIPVGWHAGTEVGLPALLGNRLTQPPGRGWIEAAACRIDVGPQQAAWRLDVIAGTTTPNDLQRALGSTGLPAQVHTIDARRNILIGPITWGNAAPGHDEPAPPSWQQRIATLETTLDIQLHAWGYAHPPEFVACDDLAVLADSTAALGIARLIHATHLASLDAAIEAITQQTHRRILIHDARPDEAGHQRDHDAKSAALTAFDQEVLGPVISAADQAGFAILVAPDHGCDPATGAHCSQPVPATWPGAPGSGTMTEAATTRLPIHKISQITGG